MRIVLTITALAATLAACSPAPARTDGASGPPPATTSSASPTTTAAAALPGKVQTFAAAVIGRMDAGDGIGRGLTSTGDLLLESTNTNGAGGIRELDPATGTPRAAAVDQPGRTVSGVAVTVRPGTTDTVWQLTQHENIAIARDRATLTPQRQVTYQGDGRGLCDDGTQLVHSDGTMRLTLRDAITFAPTATIEVAGGWWTSGHLGELECVHDNGGRAVWANLTGTSWMLRVDLDARTVTAVADLAPAMAATLTNPADEPINGIAAVANSHNQFWLTGPGWATPLRIRLIPRP